MSARCKRRTRVKVVNIAAGDTADITLDAATTEYTLRVVDGTTFAGVAFTFAYKGEPAERWHFAAGESWQEERIGPLPGALVIVIGAAVAALAELVIWED